MQQQARGQYASQSGNRTSLKAFANGATIVNTAQWNGPDRITASNCKQILSNAVGNDTPYTWKKNPVTVLNEMEQTFDIAVEYRFRLNTHAPYNERHMCTVELQGDGMAMLAQNAGRNKKAAKRGAADMLIHDMVNKGVMQVVFANEYDDSVIVCCMINSFKRRSKTNYKKARG